MVQLIEEDNAFEIREQKLEEEIPYYAGLHEQFEDEEATYEENTQRDSEEQGTDQYDSKDSSDTFNGLAAEGYLVRL